MGAHTLQVIGLTR